MLPQHRVDIFDWDGPGYRHFVDHRGWRVALMNYEERFDLHHQEQVERHNGSDEVFVLTRGQGVLFTLTDAGLQVFDMQPGAIYNVTAGTWHSCIGLPDTSWLIVECDDVGAANTDFRTLAPAELDALRSQLPAWLE